MEQKDIERFWSKVDKKGDDECWDWTGGSKNKDGYGNFWLNKKSVIAHRVSLFLATGTWGECAIHSCDQPCCVNPKHLRWGTIQENMSDKVLKNRQYIPPPGELHHNSKLTEIEVLEIRAKYLDKNRGLVKDIVAEYGISISTFYAITSRRLWSHI